MLSRLRTLTLRGTTSERVLTVFRKHFRSHRCEIVGKGTTAVVVSIRPRRRSSKDARVDTDDSSSRPVCQGQWGTDMCVKVCLSRKSDERRGQRKSVCSICLTEASAISHVCDDARLHVRSGVVDAMAVRTQCHTLLLCMPCMEMSLLRWLTESPDEDVENHVVVSEFARQVSRGLEHIHTCTDGLVHGDLSANNIVVRGNNHFYIIDFGSSCARDVLNDNFTATTMHVCSTEQLIAMMDDTCACDATQSDDVWAFGCLLFTVLRRCVPSCRVRSGDDDDQTPHHRVPLFVEDHMNSTHWGMCVRHAQHFGRDYLHNTFRGVRCCDDLFGALPHFRPSRVVDGDVTDAALSRQRIRAENSPWSDEGAQGVLLDCRRLADKCLRLAVTIDSAPYGGRRRRMNDDCRPANAHALMRWADVHVVMSLRF